MILDLPYIYWIEGDFPFRQKPVLRVTETHPFLIAEISEAELVLAEELVVGDTTYTWYRDRNGFTYRVMLNTDGSTASIDDLSNADSNCLYGHFQRRNWWRDHPSSLDLASEIDIRLAYAPPVGKPGTPFEYSKGKRIRDRPVSRSRVVARIQKLADNLRLSSAGILVRSPLPGYVVEKDDRVTIDRWVPVAREGTAPIRLFFYGHCAEQAKECAAIISDAPSNFVDTSAAFFGDGDLAAAFGQSNIISSTNAMADAFTYDVDETYYWHPLRSTLLAMQATAAVRGRAGVRKDQIGDHDGTSDMAFLFEATWTVLEIRRLSRSLGISDEAVELMIRCAAATGNS